MANIARRGFLKLLPASVMAAPVAAKEAAAKMGLKGITGWGAGFVGGSGSAAPPGIDKDWIKNALKELVDKDYRQQLTNDIRRYDARHLDADLASMRSISPAAAYHLQIDRSVERALAERRFNLMRDLKKATGF